MAAKIFRSTNRNVRKTLFESQFLSIYSMGLCTLYLTHQRRWATGGSLIHHCINATLLLDDLCSYSNSVHCSIRSQYPDKFNRVATLLLDRCTRVIIVCTQRSMHEFIIIPVFQCISWFISLLLVY